MKKHEIVVHIYEIQVLEEVENKEVTEIVGLLFINEGYDNCLIPHYLDADEKVSYAGEFKQIGSLDVLNNIPPIYRISIDE